MSQDAQKYREALRIIHALATFEVNRQATHGDDYVGMLHTMKEMAENCALVLGLDEDENVISLDDKCPECVHMGRPHKRGECPMANDLRERQRKLL